MKETEEVAGHNWKGALGYTWASTRGFFFNESFQITKISLFGKKIKTNAKIQLK